MNGAMWKRGAGPLLAVALFWSLSGGFGPILPAVQGAPAGEEEVKPANPGEPSSPSEPGSGEKHPSSPASGKAEEAAKATTPDAGAMTPATPATEAAQAGGAKLSFGGDYREETYERTTGLIFSPSHGGRLGATFVAPASAAKIYRANAALARQGKKSGFQPFPPGTTIVKESFGRNSAGGPGARGPFFVMRKEAAGYDPTGNDWRYGFAQPDMQLIGEGITGPVAFCKTCHVQAQAQDCVFAMDR